MKNLICVFFLCLAFAKAESKFMQNYKQHLVVQGETVYTLTKKYNVTLEQLVSLNPDLKSGLKYGQVLLIPAPNNVLTQRKIKEYKKHRVRRKETIYSLSKKYGITELDIKEANKELYSSPLKKGDRIQIPVFEQVKVIDEIVKEEEPLDPTNLPDGKYLVKPTEGFYRIATNYGIKTAELQQLNPEVTELRPGMILNVPKNVKPLITEENDPKATIDENQLMPYVVPPKIGMFSLKKMTGIDEDSLIALNPQLKDGLKEGMILRIPNPNYGNEVVKRSTSTSVARLVDSLRNFKRQKLAIMLPFSIYGTNEMASDSLRKKLKNDRTSRVALDFYSGVKIAIDSAIALGIPVVYDVYDTQKNLVKTKNILKATDFSTYTAVIGPLLPDNVEAAAKELRGKNVPVISPLTNLEVRLYSNLFQARPDDERLKNQLKDYLVTYARGKNVIVVTDNSNPGLRKEFTSILPNSTVLWPSAKKNYIFKDQYIQKLKSGTENVVVLAVDNVGFITDAVVNYSSKADSFKITMFGLDNYEKMDLSNAKLAKLNYVYPSMFKESIQTNTFIKSYYAIHNITPNSYATRGFDVTLDLILRQASAADLYESIWRNGKTEMTENKFDYSKKFFAGYFNDAGYLLQYQKDLSIKEIQINDTVTIKD